MTDAINPDHYKRLPVEAIEIIEAAIDDAPSNRAASLHWQVLKYVLRCWNKNGIEDLKKAKWYLDRLVDSFTEQPDLMNGLVAAWKPEDGKANQVYPEPKWKPKIGDWVKIKKPQNSPAWMPGMDRYNGQIVEVKEIDDDQSTHDDWAYIGKAIVHDEWCFMFDWLEPAQAPKPDPGEGYRLLSKDPAEEVLEGDEYENPYTKKWELDCGFFPTSQADDIYYRRKIKPAEAPKQPTEGYFDDTEGCWVDEKNPFEGRKNSDTIPEGYRKLNDSSKESRRLGDLRWSVAEKRYVEISEAEIFYANRDNWAACRKVTQQTRPPIGWRLLEHGEVIRKGDQGFEKGLFHAIDSLIGMELQTHWRPVIRRNRFEVGESVVHGSRDSQSISVVASISNDDWVDVVCDGDLTSYHVKDLAPYIEEKK